MLRLIFAAIILLICAIIAFPVMVVLFVVRIWNNRGAAVCAQNILRLIFTATLWACGIKLQVEGLENIPNEACLVVVNHRSIFDIVVLYNQIRNEMAFVAKKETKTIPLIAPFMVLLNGMFLDREDIRQGMQVILRAIELVKEGVSVCIFPEGTRNKSEDKKSLLPFHGGSFKVATKTGAPIVPIVLAGTREIFEDHLPCIKSGTVRMRVGKPVYADKLEEHDRRHIADYVRNIMLEMM